MPTASERNTTFITTMRETVTRLLQTIDTLNGLRDEYTFVGFDTILTAADFQNDANSDMTLAQFTAVITSIDNLTTFLGQGNGTNFGRARLYP